MMFGIPSEMSLSAHFSFGSDGTDSRSLVTQGAKHKHPCGGHLSVTSTHWVHVGGRQKGGGDFRPSRHRAPGFGSHVAGKPLSLPTSWRKRVLKESQLNEQAAIKKGCPQIWCLQKITGLLMKVIHHFQKETERRTRTVIQRSDGSSLLLECHLTSSTASGYRPYSSPAVMCARGRVCARSIVFVVLNATRHGDSCSSTSLSSDPSVLCNNICQVKDKPDGSFVFLVTGNEMSTERSNFTETHLSEYLDKINHTRQ